MQPEPTVEINPETAGKLGIKDGDWIYIETQHGRIKQKAVLAPWLHPRVVGLSWAWWYPERGASELYGWKEANVNMLTSDEHLSPELATPQLRGLVCRVYKAA